MPDSRPDRRPRPAAWLKRLAVCVVVGLLALLAAAAFFFHNLTRIARWTIHRTVPAVRVAMADVSYRYPGTIIVRDLVLRDRKSGEEVLRMDGGSMAFRFSDLHRRQLGEIRLVNPRLRISPALFGLLGSGAGGASGGAPAWSFVRLVCDYGEVMVEGFGPASPRLRGKFAFDWPATDAGAPLDISLWDIQGTVPGSRDPLLTLDVVQVRATPEGLVSRKEIAMVRATGGSLLIGPTLEKLFSSAPLPAGQKAPLLDWKLGLLEIQGVRVRLEDTRETATDISFALNSSIRNISAADITGALGAEERTVEVADFEILSPYDPFIKVLTMRRVLLRFSLHGILHKQIAAVEIDTPSIYIGQDLFWDMDDTQKRLAEGAGAAGSGAWQIRQLEIREGRVLVGSGGRAKYGLPLNFRASATDISLDNLASLKLQTVLEIPEQDYAFPDYQIELATKKGDLQFAYPPEKNENNLVGKVFLSALRWRQYEATDAWLSATFDKSGINGDFGGRVYGGYLSGGFSFLFEDGAPWIGWLYGKSVDMRRLTDVISPENVRLTGPVNFKLQMDAFGKNIDRVKGTFQATRPGRMTIGKLDDLLANIPDSWTNLKKSSTRIALEALRDFRYDTASGDFWFVRGQGVLGLKLQGPLGSRNFDVVLHADESDVGRWKDKP